VAVALTVADIDRWNADAVREVFHAAGARGHATLEASRQLSSLAVSDSWEGATAEARKHANASIRQDLDDHGNESVAVAEAAGKAADGDVSGQDFLSSRRMRRLHSDRERRAADDHGSDHDRRPALNR
jgi:hypothetical protein